MNQQIKFQRALMIADRKQFAKAEALLREIVDADPTTLAGCQAAVALGEIVSFDNPDEAQTILESALEHIEARGDADGDLLDWERGRIEELLTEIAEA